MQEQFEVVDVKKKRWKLPAKRLRLCERCGIEFFSHKTWCHACRLKRDIDEGRQKLLKGYMEVGKK
jgi:hypothetical protein